MSSIRQANTFTETTMGIEGRRGQRAELITEIIATSTTSVRRLPGPSYHHRRHDGPRAHVDAPVHVATSCHCHCCNGTCCRHCFRHSALPRRVYSDHDWLLPQAFFSRGVKRSRTTVNLSHCWLGFIPSRAHLAYLRNFRLSHSGTIASAKRRAATGSILSRFRSSPSFHKHILPSGTYIINLSSHSYPPFEVHASAEVSGDVEMEEFLKLLKWMLYLPMTTLLL